ncbi:hypothetical protein F3J34_11470 [Klebsiella sp. Ap-873]|nr:hypothetical protein [Klebsiella sp. Ap-873]
MTVKRGRVPKEIKDAVLEQFRLMGGERYSVIVSPGECASTGFMLYSNRGTQQEACTGLNLVDGGEYIKYTKVVLETSESEEILMPNAEECIFQYSTTILNFPVDFVLLNNIFNLIIENDIRVVVFLK